MDKLWLKAKRTSMEFQEGLTQFFKFSKPTMREGKLLCPCDKCRNTRWHKTSDVRMHITYRGFKQNYETWYRHGEKAPPEPPSQRVSMSRAHESERDYMDVDDDEEEDADFYADLDDEEWDDEYEPTESDSKDDMLEPMDEEVLANTVEMVNDARESCMEEHPSEFKQLLDDAATPLYRGCSNFTKLSAMVKLYNLKSKFGFSDAGFTELLRLFGEILPEGHVLPDSLYKFRQSFSTLGLGYEKIHCCPNNCMLFRKEYLRDDTCPKCKESRWKKDANNKPRKNVPAKVMWYFPPISRFRRMFRNPEIAKQLCWHATERRATPGILRHPADAPQWQLLDAKWPQFGSEPRNLRLGLSTDGINPHKHMSSTHSCWPVMTFAYNLPPWMCMKRKFIMLNALISGPHQPGDAIDVFLQPLIEDLQLLWRQGVRVWDGHRKEFFTMRAALLWTINDFPAYGNLSGHVVHGLKACPICSDDTTSETLKYSGKTCYWGHRRWLDEDHPFRLQTIPFNGKPELRPAPRIPTGQQILRLLETKDFDNLPKQGECWKKMSIFWSLPYWKYLYVRHNLDVMHIEKNVCEALVGTILNIPGKTKDGVKARKDLVHMGIRGDLAATEKSDKGKSYLPAAAYALKKGEKKMILQCLSNIKVPDGYSSNFNNKVSMQTLKFKAMKSHDLHVLMQQFFPIAIRSALQPHVRVAVLRLCSFFNEVCMKEIVVSRLDEIQRDLVLTLCLLEQIFPPAFFTSMVHLTVHLIREIKLCGPVHFRWMYPIERYMKFLKGYVRNHTYPEGCIVENYIAEEVIEFCASYQKGTVTIGHPPGRYELHCGPDASVGSNIGPGDVTRVTKIELMQAHTYVLNNWPEIDPYITDHFAELHADRRNKKKPGAWFQEEHNRTFVTWINQEVERRSRNNETISPTVLGLSRGPMPDVIKYPSYTINGFTFRTYGRDATRKTQNYGVSVDGQETVYIGNKAETRAATYYGIVDEIWDINYFSFRVPIFKCRWINNNTGLRKDEMGFTSVTFDRIGYHNDSFIMASHAKQVFYVQDPAAPDWFVVLTPPQYKLHNPADDTGTGDIEAIPNPFVVANRRALQPTINTNNDNQMCRGRPQCDGAWV